MSRLVAILLLWILWFAISFGLGYPTLNRYDPASPWVVAPGAAPDELADPGEYRALILGTPADAVRQAQTRILVPLLARPVYALVEGRTGSWHPVWFSMLVVNAAWTATACCVLLYLGRRLGAMALLGVAIYLLNWVVANEQLAGMVDSAEGCLLLALAAVLSVGAWWPLPLMGVVGALAKDTFVPLAVVFALAWLVARRQANALPLRELGWVLALAVSGLATVLLLRSLIAGIWVEPFTLLADEASGEGLVVGLAHVLGARNFWYVFAWLLPLGVWSLRRFPVPWAAGSLAAMGTALLLGAYTDAGGNTARAMFNAGGPLLSLSAALTIAQIASKAVPTATSWMRGLD
jgi:hypothetical protein